jgi:hypothetical protein
MEKLVLILCLGLLPLLVSAQRLEVIKTQKISGKEKFNSHRYGGISGLIYSDGILFGISDDRGGQGPPRFYKHSLIDNTLEIQEEILVQEPQDVSVVDFESFDLFKNGNFLISSEGDLNKKPRVLPFVRIWSPSGIWGKEIPLPENFLPEKIGMQTKGLQNNSAFEGITLSPDEKSLFLMSELPLFQNQKMEIEFLKYKKKKSKWALEFRKAYLRNAPPEGVLEVMRGVTELLYWKKDYLLVLERWVRMSDSKAVVLGAELFSVNTENLKKKKLFSFDGDLAGNWEGMTWGPDLSDGRKLLILVSDNNFVKSTPTQFLFISFQEE